MPHHAPGGVGNPTINTKWRIDVDTSESGPEEWVQVRGVNNFTPAVNNTVQDASDFDSEGWGADAVTQRKWQNQLSVMRKEYTDDSTVQFDPGQEYLRQLADSLNLAHVRWYERGVVGGEAYEGWALVQWEPQGGDGTALSTVNVTLLGQGARLAVEDIDESSSSD